jgi:hypothetical protein
MNEELEARSKPGRRHQVREYPAKSAPVSSISIEK